MSKVGDRRLLKLADFLDQLPSERFNFAEWVGKNWGGDQKLSCGTSACAMGWAATMPAFRRLGLYLTRGGTGLPTVAIRSEKSLTGDYYGLDVACELFHITWNDASVLFLPTSRASHPTAIRLSSLKPLSQRATPQAVAANIRKFVAS